MLSHILRQEIKSVVHFYVFRIWSLEEILASKSANDTVFPALWSTDSRLLRITVLGVLVVCLLSLLRVLLFLRLDRVLTLLDALLLSSDHV